MNPTSWLFVLHCYLTIFTLVTAASAGYLVCLLWPWRH